MRWHGEEMGAVGVEACIIQDSNLNIEMNHIIWPCSQLIQDTKYWNDSYNIWPCSVVTNMKQIMQAVGVLANNTDQFRNRLCKYKNLKKKKSLCFVYSLPSIVLAAPPPCCMWQKSRNNKMAEKWIFRNPITYDTLKFYSNETLIICKLFLSKILLSSYGHSGWHNLFGNYDNWPLEFLESQWWWIQIRAWPKNPAFILIWNLNN